MADCNCIILAAGKGTRMKSEKPKVSFMLAGKPLINRVYESVKNLELKRIVVVVGFKKEQVINLLPADRRILFAEQKEQLGTGHAVMSADIHLKEQQGNTLILCGDVPLLKTETIEKILLEHISTDADCTILTAELEDPGSYGRMVRDQKNCVKKIVEFKDATVEQKKITEINTGIYCFKNKPLFEELSNISDNNAQREYYLTDLVDLFYQRRLKISSVHLNDLKEITGVNSLEELSILEIEYFNQLKKEHLKNGVSIENPETVIIYDDVEILQDVRIGPHTIIKNNTKIESNVYVGPFCLIEDSLISENVYLTGYNVVVNKHVPPGSILDFRE